MSGRNPCCGNWRNWRRGMNELLQQFNAAGIRYLLVGGQAMRLAGMPRYTMDWDFFIPPRDENNFAVLNRAWGNCNQLMEYEAVIGLETHVQLKTKSKMWCGCANEFGAPPNTNVCPVCLGLPGVLPVANDEGLRLTTLTGYLLNCTIPRFAKFDRKNYFYPDAPKNYQITQYDRPSTISGYVDFEFKGSITRVRITRAHLEEDVGKNFHFDRNSGVDFNRARVPLLEIVSEPDITSSDMAYEYLNALKDILMHGGVSDCDMEKGMVRCDVNVSVRPVGQKELGAKIEI